MTDEKRLHEMMADPGPAPEHDANGWPVKPLPFQDPAGLRWAPEVDDPAPEDSAGPADPPYSASPSGTGGPDDEWVDAVAPTWLRPDQQATTSGLADTAAGLAVGANDLARLARDVREEIEGRRREAWDAVVTTARLAEIGDGQAAAQFAAGVQYGYLLAAGLDGEEIDRRVAAELDARYGTDRAKGGATDE